MNEPKAVNWEQKLTTPARTFKPFPGLFFYEAWGYGNYYSSDGNKYWCQTSEGHRLAARDGLDMKVIDALENYQPVYLGD